MFRSRGYRTAGLLAVVLLGLSVSVSAQQREPGRGELRGDLRGILKAIDAGKQTLTIMMPTGRETPVAEKTLPLAPGAEVCVASPRGPGLFAPIKLADLSAGLPVSVALSPDQKSIVSIVAEEPLVRGLLKAIDPKKNTMTLSLQAGREAAAEEKDYTLAGDVEILLDDGRGRRTSLREGKLVDVNPGSTVMVRLSIDRKTVRAIQIEPAIISGTVKAIDAEKRAVTVTTRTGRGDEAGEEKTVTIAKDALILTDDGRGRRLSVQEVPLAQVTVGSVVSLRLSGESGNVVLLRAEAPSVFGLLKAIDAEKGTITITIPRGRDDAEEKKLSLLRDVVVNLEGKEAKLTDLKVADGGPFVQLRLTLDQQSVQSIVARQPRPR